MRITYYTFPDDAPEDVMLQYGCRVFLKSGGYIFPDTIPDDRRDQIDHIDTQISCSVSTAKKLMKQYGGSACTQHIDRDGGCFEVTPIVLRRNNSKFKYNHHL